MVRGPVHRTDPGSGAVQASGDRAGASAGVEETAKERGSIAILSSIALGSDRTAALGWHEAMGFERFGDVVGMFPGEQTEAFFVKILEP